MKVGWRRIRELKSERPVVVIGHCFGGVSCNCSREPVWVLYTATMNGVDSQTVILDRRRVILGLVFVWLSMLLLATAHVHTLDHPADDHCALCVYGQHAGHALSQPALKLPPATPQPAPVYLPWLPQPAAGYPLYDSRAPPVVMI